MAEEKDSVTTKAPAEGGLSVKSGKRYKPGRVLRVWDANGNPIVVDGNGFFVVKNKEDEENLAYHAKVGNIEVV